MVGKGCSSRPAGAVARVGVVGASMEVWRTGVRRTLRSRGSFAGLRMTGFEVPGEPPGGPRMARTAGLAPLRGCSESALVGFGGALGAWGGADEVGLRILRRAQDDKDER